MKKRRRLAAFAAIAAISLLAAGCSSSSGSSGSGKNSTIKLMVDAIMTPAASLGGIAYPYSAVGVQAAAAALNKKGGIDGHPIHIDVCDNQGNPDQSAVCGRKAKSNGDIAVVGSFDPIGATQLLPVLQAAGIPYVGGIAANPLEVSSPNSYTFDAGGITGPYSTAGALNDQGCKNAAVLSVMGGQAGAQEQLAQMKNIAAADHYKMSLISISATAASVAAPVSSTLSLHPDCVSFLGGGQTAVKVVTALKQGGYKGKIITSMASLLPPFLKTLGSLGDGIITINEPLDPNSANPGVTSFRNDVTSYVGSKSAAAADLNEYAQDGWSAMQLVDKALAGTGNYTSAELLKKLPTMCDVDLGNYYPHINLCKPVTHSTVYPHVYSDNWLYYVAKNGVYVPVDNKWHDYSSTIPTS